MISVLDHGYVELIETWGSDERIIEAARMSTGKGFLGWGPNHQPACAKNERFVSEPWKLDCTCEPQPGDEKLLRFMYENQHSTPFEFAGATFEVQAPIFVFREWHRHRTQSYSEASARYSPLPDVNYVPSVERLLINSKTNKQAGAVKNADTLDVNSARNAQHEITRAYQEAQRTYDVLLMRGVPKELARIVLPVGRYSRMRASTDLRNWLGFLTLRMDENAQWEIRQYAEVVHKMLGEKFPRTLALFDEGRR
jgi:thymidylate synthase (FAD)